MTSVIFSTGRYVSGEYYRGHTEKKNCLIFENEMVEYNPIYKPHLMVNPSYPPPLRVINYHVRPYNHFGGPPAT